jgi:hypothetical protein
MSLLWKVLKWTLLFAGGLVLTLALILLYYKYVFYEAEMRSIKSELNAIPGVEVINIWGHKDVTLEEVTARIHLEGKGELVLANLSKDEFRYPEQVILNSIGGFSFRTFYCSQHDGFGSAIDIGTGSYLGERLGLEFTKPEEVVRQYDRILEFIADLNRAPEPNHIQGDGYEAFLFVAKIASRDGDPIQDLFGADSMYEVGRRLPWTDTTCFSYAGP